MLRNIRYLGNPYDKCIFNRLEIDGSQSIIVIHVDDLLVTTKSEEHIDRIEKELNSFYGGVEIHRGRTMEYLGIVFDNSNEEYLEISMDKYMEDLVKDSEVTGVVSTPATEDFFNIDKESPLLNEKERAIFHSTVAKLLYPAKQVRMDLQLAVGFPTTRVQKTTI